MRVTYCHRQSVGGVCLQLFAIIQQHADHVLNLLLASGAGTGDALLDQSGRVFTDQQSGIDSGTDCRPARLPELQRRHRIFVHKDILDGALLWLPLLDNGADFGKDIAETLGKCVTARGNVTMRYIHTAIAVTVDNTVTGGDRTGIDSKYPN